MISFVYFDVGGVALKDFSDSPKWDVMLAEMGLDKFDRILVDEIYDSREDEVATGKMHIDSILPFYISEFGLSIDPSFSMQKYFIDHFDQNLELWPIIKELKKTTRIGLLTDIYPGMLDEIFTRDLLAPVTWDVLIDSSVEGVRKPSVEIYELATKRAGVPPEEIFFIDNRQKNIVGAQKAGWQTFLYDSKNYEKSSRDLARFLDISGK